MPTPSHAAAARPRSRRGSAAVKAVVAVVAVAGLAGGVMLLRGAGDERTAAAASRDIVAASVRSFDISTLANGELEAKNQIEIRSELESQATIVEIVPEGARVESGDVLVRLNTEEIERRLADEELNVVQARSELEAAAAAEKIQESDNASKLRAAESKLALAKLALQQWEEGDVIKTMRQNDLTVEKAEKDLERLSAKFAQSKLLLEREFVSRDEFQRDEIAYIDAVATLERARLDRDVYLKFQKIKDGEQKRLDVDEAESELERTIQQNEINLKDKQRNSETRRAQLALREDRFNKLKRQIELSTIRAPSAGLVVYASSTGNNRWRWNDSGGLGVGKQVSPNDAIIYLPDTSEMIASVKVHEALAGRVRPGQRASIRIDAQNLVIPGRVDSVGVLAESGDWRDPNRREYTVKIALEPGDNAPNLKPTLRCEAEIFLGRVDEALAVPVQAVFNEGAVRYVYTPSGDRYERRPVRIGRRSDTDVEILAGIEAGETVLLRAPRAGETLPDAWDDAKLTLAGYTRGEDGQIRSAAARGMPGGAPGTAPAGGQRPAGDGAARRTRPEGGSQSGTAKPADSEPAQANAEPAAKPADAGSPTKAAAEPAPADASTATTAAAPTTSGS